MIEIYNISRLLLFLVLCFYDFLHFVLLDSFKESFQRFSRFLTIYLLILCFPRLFLLCYVFQFVCCFICALNGNNEAGYCTCWPFACRKNVLSLRMLGKNEFFEIQTCLEPGAHLLIRHKYLQLHTKNPQLQAEKQATTGNSTQNFRQSAIRPRVSSRAHCR